MPGAISDEAILRELQAIKGLLALTLLLDGVSQEQIGLALGVSQPTVSRMFLGIRPKDRAKG